MQDVSVSEPDTARPGFSTIERLVLVSGACVLTLWIGGLAWAGYEIAAFIS